MVGTWAAHKLLGRGSSRYRVAEGLPEERRYVVWKLFNQASREQKGRSLLKHDEPQGITEEAYKDTHGARPVGVELAGIKSHSFREDRMSLLVRRHDGDAWAV